MYNRIKDYLNEKGIKQKMIAQKIGMDENTLSATLSGRRKMLACEYLSICDALQVPPDTFWKGV